MLCHEICLHALILPPLMPPCDVAWGAVKHIGSVQIHLQQEICLAKLISSWMRLVVEGLFFPMTFVNVDARPRRSQTTSFFRSRCAQPWYATFEPCVARPFLAQSGWQWHVLAAFSLARFTCSRSVRRCLESACRQAGPHGSFGTPFNEGGGGIFAAEWNPEAPAMSFELALVHRCISHCRCALWVVPMSRNALQSVSTCDDGLRHVDGAR